MNLFLEKVSENMTRLNWTEEKISQTLAEIDRKAREDRDFRELCLQNPNEAVRRISGQEVPTGIQIRFIENEGAHLTHVLPDYTGSEDELTEDELLQVSAAGESTKDPTNNNFCPECGSSNTKVFTRKHRITTYCNDCEAVSYYP